MAVKNDRNRSLARTRVTKLRIDEFPNDVLITIISFLSVKEAIRTSILAKRWRNLQLFMPRLNIDADTFLYPIGKKHRHCIVYSGVELRKWEDIEPIVDKIFERYSDSKIKFFRLSVPSYPVFPYESGKNAWIRAAIERGAEELDIDYFEYAQQYAFRVLPLLQPSKLKHLHLRNCRIPSDMDLQPLNSMETLELDRVWVRTATFDCIFSTWPNLRKLVMRDCYDPFRRLTTNPPNLATLEYDSMIV